MSEYPWPHSVAGDDVPKEVAHALGILAINWNWCESAHELILGALLNTAHARVITSPMPNNMRANLLADLVATTKTPKAYAEAVNHFQRCYAICLENRNILMHSVVAPHDFLITQPLAFIRDGRRREKRLLQLTCDATQVAHVANECGATFTFAMRLFQAICRGAPAPSLGTLALPRTLAPDPSAR